MVIFLHRKQRQCWRQHCGAESSKVIPQRQTPSTNLVNVSASKEVKSTAETIGVPQLNEETLAHIGKDPNEKPLDFLLHPVIASQCNTWLVMDVVKELTTDTLPKYPRKMTNCLLEAPQLNPEIANSLAEATIKRDKYFSNS